MLEIMKLRDTVVDGKLDRLSTQYSLMTTQNSILAMNQETLREGQCVIANMLSLLTGTDLKKGEYGNWYAKLTDKIRN